MHRGAPVQVQSKPLRSIVGPMALQVVDINRLVGNHVAHQVGVQP